MLIPGPKEEMTMRIKLIFLHAVEYDCCNRPPEPAELKAWEEQTAQILHDFGAQNVVFGDEAYELPVTDPQRLPVKGVFIRDVFADIERASLGKLEKRFPLSTSRRPSIIPLLGVEAPG